MSDRWALVQDIVMETADWFDAGRDFALATVVRTWESAPRAVGASMAVDRTGRVVGSVSGGCVEGAVYALAQQVLSDGRPRLESYGVSSREAAAVGLTCGGTLQVLIERVDRDTFPQFAQVRDAVRGGADLAVATLLPGPGPVAGGHLVVGGGYLTGSLGDPGLDHGVAGRARGLMCGGASGVLRLGAHGGQRLDSVAVFVEVMAAPPTTIVFGAIDFAAALVRAAKLLGHRVVVCDARPVFATTERFPEADEVVVDWPHRYLTRTPVDERTSICVLTHDPKFDVPLLEVALRTKAGYIGAMGSRATHLDRLRQLREVGVTEDELLRLSSPIGLDLGGRTPAETAVSIVAEMVADRWGGTGRRLREVDGPLHR